MPDSIDDILATTENPAYVRVATARVLLRQDLAARHEELDAQLTAAMEADGRLTGIGDAPQSPAVAEQVRALEAEMESLTVPFRFRALSKRVWSDLIAQHPPTKDQTRAHPQLDHNPETFPVAAVAASCIDPAMTLEQAQRLETSLNQSQWGRLWAACLDANVGVDAPKSVAAGMLRRLNGASERPLTTTAFPAASSSDES
jgi:hypothetical protein